jgi:superfamily I DNA and/or RNA helicase
MFLTLPTDTVLNFTLLALIPYSCTACFAALQVIVVEEAAEVLEAHILTSLTSATEHVILIGDHLQLPPKVETYDLQQESGRGFDLNVSLFERLVRQGSVQHVMLEEQRRMHPTISQ